MILMSLYQRLVGLTRGAMRLYEDSVKGYNRLSRTLAASGVRSVTTRLETKDNPYLILDRSSPTFAKNVSAVDFFLVIQPDVTGLPAKRIKVGTADDRYLPLGVASNYARERARMKAMKYGDALRKRGISVVNLISSPTI